ncbi:hypothetical protein Y032_0400g761 [Ancylostoma ceylanicum]|uniref:Uncharacterized protein n=1 Tax=Ancylostoma ceylanicum TaxID=53326 RepID=A0A016RS12_9BILA|nr:hypothetical protein Y032_0400g761 [Ancylostoma ceylanicum]
MIAQSRHNTKCRKDRSRKRSRRTGAANQKKRSSYSEGQQVTCRFFRFSAVVLPKICLSSDRYDVYAKV